MESEKNTLINYSGKRALYGVSSMISKLETVGMLKPMEALKAADPKKWHYGNSFDPAKIDNNYSSFTKILSDLNVNILWMNSKKNFVTCIIFMRIFFFYLNHPNCF